MNKLTIASNHDADINDAQTDTVTLLREVADKIENGVLPANGAIIIAINDDIDKFDFSASYNLRAIKALGYLRVAEEQLIRDMEFDF